MVFGGAPFLKFMAVALTVFWAAPARYRGPALLVLSLAYYASFRAPVLLAVLAAVACAAWLAGRRIAAAAEPRAQAGWLWGGVAAMLLALIATRAAASWGGGWGPLRVASTIGVSYFTLQAIAYVADVYLGRSAPEPSLGRVALFLAFFPKVAQGPIERGRKLLPQLGTLATPAYPALRAAAVLFAWGLFKKAVLADRLALLVDPVYGDVARFGGLAPIAATYAYAFQLYFDFSGYTDMARGVAGFFGVELSENFASPYLATSIAEFWRRWHVTFSRWLLDYVFTPLQLRWRALRRAGTALALLVTFSLSGIWHGATGCFAIWGTLHGAYLAASVLLAPQRSGPAPAGVRRAARIAVTFHLVAFAWVFFRAATVRDALTLLAGVARPGPGLGALVAQAGPRSVAVTLLACAAYAAIASARRRPGWAAAARRPALRWSAYAALGAAILVLGQSSLGYIYFQF